jgi:hypothetical protein
MVLIALVVGAAAACFAYTVKWFLPEPIFIWRSYSLEPATESKWCSVLGDTMV